MKKVIILLFALSVLTYGCGGGGGAGSADLPPGENPGSASLVQLWPNNYVAQTNAYITLYAKVLDGNGHPVSGVDVTFTNLSGVGTLSNTSARTDGTGLAMVTISSPTSGFSTILAQINTASGVVRDRKTIYFSTNSLSWPLPSLLSLSLDVDGDNDGVFNEQDDFTILEGVNDNQVLIRATVFDEFGLTVPFSTVSFGSDSAEVSFPVGNTAKTDINGKAQVLVQINPSALRSFSTVINITAQADNGAANIVSLFLNPVIVSSITVTASPTTVEVNSEATIIASVSTSIGTPAPDGTTVNFTANCGLSSPQGQIDPTFPQTTNGMAKTTFKSPSDPTTCEVKATAGGKTGSVFITVIPPPSRAPEPTPTPALNIVPGDATVGPGEEATYVIVGGTGPYTVTTNYPGITLINGNPPPYTLGSGVTSFTVTNTFSNNNNNCTDTRVTITVLDSSGATATATYKIDCP